eukprot:Em0001g3497a
MAKSIARGRAYLGDAGTQKGSEGDIRSASVLASCFLALLEDVRPPCRSTSTGVTPRSLSVSQRRSAPCDALRRGMYIGDDDPEDQSLCVVEHKAIKSLCQGLVQQCCCRSRPSWELESFMKLPCQFANFCTFAELGEVKQRYISSMYTERQFQRIVAV